MILLHLYYICKTRYRDTNAASHYTHVTIVFNSYEWASVLAQERRKVESCQSSKSVQWK